MDDIRFRNIGWTLGNECPFRCSQCYSMLARKKGRNLTIENIDRIIDQFAINDIETVNLGGNEPLYTNGPNSRNTLLPYIIHGLHDRGIPVGLTTAGVTINYIVDHHYNEFMMLNDVDVSFDSPFCEEHNDNRGATLFDLALKSLTNCQKANIDHTIVMCGMNWNLSERHLDELIVLAKRTESNLRINFMKPTEASHISKIPTPEQFYAAALYLFDRCDVVDLGEPLLSNTIAGTADGCPCGVHSFRINSITPDGKVPISPCVYMHDFSTGDLITQPLYDIVRSPAFDAFRKRHNHPDEIAACMGCKHLNTCRGGCAARSYYTQEVGKRTLFSKDPYCFMDLPPRQFEFPFDQDNVPAVLPKKILVHQNYLCTYILKPR